MTQSWKTIPNFVHCLSSCSWEYERLIIMNHWTSDVEELKSYFRVNFSWNDLSVICLFLFICLFSIPQLKTDKCGGRTQVYVQHLSHKNLSSVNTDLFLGGSSFNEDYKNIWGLEEVYSGLKPIIFRSHNSMPIKFYIGKMPLYLQKITEF